MADIGGKAAKKKEMRKRDPFADRRSGDDRRKVYSLEYFQQDNPDRRVGRERRTGKERRGDCVRVSTWSSVCPDYEDDEYREGRIRLDKGPGRKPSDSRS